MRRLTYANATALAMILLLFSATRGFAQNVATKGTIIASPVRSVFNVDARDSLKEIKPALGPVEYEGGYTLVDGAFRCETREQGEKGKGVRYAFELNQTKPSPILATGWSRAFNVEGNKGSDYSLYLDIAYADGTMLWGQTYAFPTGTADWSEGKVCVFPDKPIKSLSFYGLFRGLAGTVDFKDFALCEFDLPNRVAYFDFTPIELDGSLTESKSAQIVAREFGADADDRFFAVSTDALDSPQSVANFNGALVSLDRKTLTSEVDEIALHLRSEVDRDVVLTLYYVLPIQADPNDEIAWFDDARKNRVAGINESRVTRAISDVGSGASSRYPFGVVARRRGEQKNGEFATIDYVDPVGLAIHPDYPAFFRIVYNGATRELYAAFDLALTPEKPTAELRLAEIRAQNSDTIGSNPFRSTFDAYRRAYPEAFRVRAVKQGNWMAFAKISKLPDWQDFGFQFKEGIDETNEDDSRNISSFRYTEPMTWWQQIPKSETSPKTLEGGLAVARAEANNVKAREQRALLVTGFRDVDGRFYGKLLDTPWCDGAVWSMNDAPGLARLAREGKLKNADNEACYESETAPLSGFEIKWNETTANNLYGEPLPKESLPKTRDELVSASTRAGVDGEYIDSSEGYVTATLDFDRSHFEGMTTPLTFDAETKRPAIFRGLIAYEYARQISGDVHARGKLVMANSTPSLHFWLAPTLDVLGTETNWNWGGAWRPMPDEELMYRRIMCCGKPYCFLMNTNFDDFTHEMTERYMKRALAYGMFPSFFSQDASTRHYFENPDLYERDRDLFKKYMPIVTPVAEAGWEPLPLALSDAEDVYVERFGSIPNETVPSNPLRPDAAIYLTIFNDSQETKNARVKLDDSLSALVEKGAEISEITQGTDVGYDSNTGVVALGNVDAQDVRVLKIEP